MITLPVWFVWAFDLGFSVITLSALGMSVVSLIDVVRDVRALYGPQSRTILGDITWRVARVRRIGDLIKEAMTIPALLGLGFIGVLSALGRHGDERISWAVLAINIFFVILIALLAGQSFVREIMRILVRRITRDA